MKGLVELGVCVGQLRLLVCVCMSVCAPKLQVDVGGRFPALGLCVRQQAQHDRLMAAPGRAHDQRVWVCAAVFRMGTDALLMRRKLPPPHPPFHLLGFPMQFRGFFSSLLVRVGVAMRCAVLPFCFHTC